ncbi:TWiK family of potassium channels protein 7 [Aphelenchoides besseyi]|nr:TWiK family of potassium channels protein 7 [Aphelenchoides besseyi]
MARSKVKSPTTQSGSRNYRSHDHRAKPAAFSVANMCGGLVQSGFCHFTELPGQFGLTKQLVLRITLPHISLLLISIGYALAGCWILTAINYKTDSLEAEQLIENAKLRYKSRLLEWIEHNKPHKVKDQDVYAKFKPNLKTLAIDSENVAAQDFSTFATELFEVYARFPRSTAVLDNVPIGLIDEKANNTKQIVRKPLTNISWNLFFIVTTLTSIAPDSFVGRMFCCCYVAIGIPLFLICLADMAKFCTEFINRSYTEYLKVKHRLKTRWKRWRARAEQQNGLSNTNEESETEFLWTHLEDTQFVEIPFLLIYAILLGWIILTSYLIAYMEGWSLQSGFYFTMMSVLTVGFGDLMPSNDDNILAILALILTGLIICTCCIDIIGGHYIDKLHFFGRRLDVEDPLLWLKAVQQKRIDAMKRDAMRKLFETIAALNRMHLDTNMETKVPLINADDGVKIIEPPDPPRNLIAYNATAESMGTADICGRGKAILVHNKLQNTYSTKTPYGHCHRLREYHNVRSAESEVIHFVRIQCRDNNAIRMFEADSNARIHGAVPQSIRIESTSSETATVAWRAPRKNNGTESYVVMFAQEPAPQFRYWRRYRVGRSHVFTITGLNADTHYVCCILAEHNFGLAAMSKSIRFKTRIWDFESSDEEIEENYEDSDEKGLIPRPSSSFGPRTGRRPTTLSSDIKNDFTENPMSQRRRSSQFGGNDSLEPWEIPRSPIPAMPMWKPKPIELLPDPQERLLFLAPPRQARAVISAARAAQSQFLKSPMHRKPLISFSPVDSSLTQSSRPISNLSPNAIQENESKSTFHLSPQPSE